MKPRKRTRHPDKAQQAAKAAAKLKRLRSLPYDEYLQTPHWRRKRRKAIRRHGDACQCCGSRIELEVHHKHYRTKGRENFSDLEVLCRDCHIGKHQDEKPWLVDSVTAEFLQVIRGW